MKVSEMRLIELEGILEGEGDFWEERLIRPIDLYPEHRAEGPSTYPARVEGGYLIRAIFLKIETDEGLIGLSGPMSEIQAFLIDRSLRPLLLGQDPLAVELLWDKMYRASVHGRKGEMMMAISVVDCGLWDLRGKWAGAPVYRLLGGPTRERIPAYASTLGYSLEPEAVRRRAQAFVQEGYGAMKWFFRHGPSEGREGMIKNLELARTVREAIGDEVDIMLDCWMSWDVPYTIAMAEEMYEYNPRWLEEPVLPDKIDCYAQIRQAVWTPIAGGEHEYTRWGIHKLLEARAVDILQPDIYWAGGITELMKICALASAYDIPVIPHGHSVPAAAHLIAAQPPNLCPLLEFLVKWNQIHQFFLKKPILPERGFVALPEAPGLGLELDEDKIRARRELKWG